jgi:arylsulfatase A-like enzyme
VIPHPQVRASSTGRALSLSLLVLGGIVAGCREPPPPGLRSHHRLVERAYRVRGDTRPASLVVAADPPFPAYADSSARLPEATVGDDTRHVLAGHPTAPLAILAPTELLGGQRLALTLPVPKALTGANALVVDARARLNGERDWEPLPPIVTPVQATGDAEIVTLDALVPAFPSGAEVQIYAVAYRPPGVPVTEHRTTPIDVPDEAALELSFGVLDIASGFGSVHFYVEACDGDACEPLLDERFDPAAAPAGWQDRRTALTGLAGTTRSFRFRTVEETGASLPVWGDPTVLAPAQRGDPRRSILLISIDTLRRDHLDLYGYERETAPFLRSLGERGTVFERLVAEAATTAPSHMTMFTSLPALVHGVHNGLTGLAVPVRPLAELLRSRGYATAAFTENGPLAKSRGFGIGFSAYGENTSADLMNPSGHVERTFAQAQDWLTRHGDRPFFLFLHTFQVHAPYAPPERYEGLFTERATSVPLRGTRPAEAYDREIRYVDDQVRALLDWLSARGLTERTIVVVTSDHGEEFYEHGSLGHGTLPYETVLGVPLIVTGPDVAAGVRRTSLVHHLDLMPTILDLAGVEVPTGLYGQSFAALLRAGEEPTREPAPLFSASWELPPGLESPAHAVRVGQRKLVRFRHVDGEQEKVFDVGTDPGERRALDPQTASDLAALLDARETQTEADRLRLRGEAGAPAEPAALDPEYEEKLRELGYLD